MSESLLLLPHPNFQDLVNNNRLVETYLDFYEKDLQSGNRTRGSTFFLYLFVSTFKNVVSVENCINFLKDIKAQGKLDSNTIIETVFLISCDIEKLDKKEKTAQEYKTQFLDFLKQIDAQGIVDKELLVERLEETFLSEANIIDKAAFLKKKARINRKNLYEQQKYNLFKEENEGFAKLIIEVLQNEYINPQYMDAVKKNVLSLVGYFDLDPNRVLDILLDAYECFPDNLYYHEIISGFKADAIPHLLGLKFQSYQKITDCTTSCAPSEIFKTLEEKGMTPLALFRITANLIKAKIVRIEDIWTHLSPGDDKTEAAFSDKYQTASKLFKRNYEKRLNASDEEKKKEKEAELQNIATIESQLIYNQKLWLMEALVRNNSWLLFEKLFVARNCIIDLTSHLPLLNSICEFLEWLIEPVYRPISPTRFTKRQPKLAYFPYDESLQGEQLNRIYKLDFEAFETILRVLKVVGPAVGRNVLVYTKLCRLIKHYLESPKGDDHERINKLIVYMTTQILLPTISLVRANPGVVATLWSILQEFDYIIRFQAYEDWLVYQNYSKPSLMLEGYYTIKQMGPWFKTVTPDTVKQKGRILGNISHNNPGLVFKMANYVMKNYSNLIEPIVNALSYSSNLSLDMIIFLVLRDLSNSSYEEKASEQFMRDGTISDVHGNFSTFLGHFLRKYYTVDLTGIFSFLTERLLKKQYLDLIILREIISNMSGNEALEALNYNQLQALAGGIYLQIESAAVTNDFKKAKKSSSSLKNFFFKKTVNYLTTSSGEPVSFAFGLLVCLGVLRSEILYTDFEIGLKLIGNLYDKISDSIVQLTQFLRYHTKESSTLYSSLFPKEALLRLTLDYKIVPELVFHIMRPSIKPMHSMTPEERSDLIELFKKSFDNFDSETMCKQKNPSFYAVHTPEFVWKDIKLQVWKNVTPELYTLFWALSLDNIYVPVERYDAEVQRLNEEISNLDKGADAQKTTKAKKDKNIERIQNSKENFENEKQKLLQNKDKIDKFIEERKEMLFEGTTPKRINHVFVQVCLFPRLIFSPGDAVYAAKFVEKWHKVRRVSYIDFLYSSYTILTIVLSCLQASTERETGHIGIFFTELFQLISSWHDESSLKQVVRGFSANEPFEFHKLQHIILTTFARMRGILKSCLLTKDYIKAKNSILFLNKVMDIFPPIEEDAKVIREAIEKLQQNFADYEDIRKLGESYLVALKKKQDTLPDVDRNAIKKKVQGKDKKTTETAKSSSRDRRDIEEHKSSRNREGDDRKKGGDQDDHHKAKRSRDQLSASDKDKDRERNDRHDQRHLTTRKDTKGDRDNKDKDHLDTESFDKKEKKLKREEGEKEKNRDERNSDRNDRNSDRNDRNDRNNDRNDRGDRGDRGERGERGDKQDKQEKQDKQDKNDRPRDKSPDSRDKERDHREKEREREREREREKDREREKTRGGENDDKDKDRNQSQRKNDGNNQQKSKAGSTTKKK